MFQARRAWLASSAIIQIRGIWGQRNKAKLCYANLLEGWYFCIHTVAMQSLRKAKRQVFLYGEAFRFLGRRDLEPWWRYLTHVDPGRLL